MTARERESAQDFATLARKLLATKLSVSTAVALLEDAVDRIDCLVTALGDQETELAHALHDQEPAPADADFPPRGADDSQCGEFLHEVGRTFCCTADASHSGPWHVEHASNGHVYRYWPVRPECACCGSPSVGEGENWCAACQAETCDQIQPRIFLEFGDPFNVAAALAVQTPSEVLAGVGAVIGGVLSPLPAPPWSCYECGDPDGSRCSSKLTHQAEIWACVKHSVPDGGAGRECLECAERRDQAASVTGAVRPAGWVCSRCDKRYPGRKPEDGLCAACEFAADPVVGQLVIRLGDDSPVPVMGRITGLGEFVGSVRVAWGEQADAADPRTVTEPLDDLTPVRADGPSGTLRVLPGGAATPGQVEAASELMPAGGSS